MTRDTGGVSDRTREGGRSVLVTAGEPGPGAWSWPSGIWVTWAETARGRRTKAMEARIFDVVFAVLLVVDLIKVGRIVLL